MIPEPSPSISPSGADEKFDASFRRGKRLVAILAVVTGGVLLAGSLDDYFKGHASGGLTSLLVSWALVGWICWCVFRGGPLAGGCLLFLSIPVLLGLLLGTLALVFNGFVPGGHASVGVGNLHDIGSDRESTAWFLPFGAWSAYTIWVLLISKDARLYREARRQGIAEAEAKAFRWPPVGRRQG